MTAIHPPAPPARPARAPLRVLHLEDSDADSAVVRLYLERQGFDSHIVRAHHRADFLEHLTGEFDVVLADHSMPGFDSYEALRLVREHRPEVPFIIVSGKITEAAAVESIKSGAADYIWKDRLQRLGPAIETALRERWHRAEHEAALRGSQESLSQNQARLKAIFDGSLDAILLADDEGRYVDVNPAAAALLGYTCEELVGLSVRDIAVPEQQDSAAEGWAAFRAAGRVSGEFTAMRKDGAFVPTEFNATADVLPGLHLSILRDVTERQAAAAEFERNQIRMKAIFEGSLDAILLADDDGRYVDANPAAAALLGYSREEFLGMGVTDVLSIPPGQDFSERWAALRARGTDSGEFVLYRKDGTAVEVEQRATFNVLPGLHISTIRDVTERKAAEASLTEASRRNAEILESIDDGFFAVDADWRFTYVNARAEDYWQREPADLIGKEIWAEFPAIAGSAFETHYRRAIETGRPEAFEAYYSPLQAHRTVRVFPFDGGISVYFRDVTEERRSEIALRESEERLQLVSRATNDTVWDWDMRTETVAMNEAFTEVFGWTAPEGGGFTIGWMLEHIHPDDRKRVAESLHGIAWGDEQVWEAEYCFERDDGTWADVVNRSHIVRSADGRALRIVGAVVDLTARKETERALVEAKEAAEEVARAKSSLLMNMSHEIRTPLTAVIGYAEMLAHEAPPDLMDLVEPIERGAKRLLDTLNSVLDLAQIEAGALPLATVAVDLRAEADAAVAALRPLAQAKGLTLALTGPPTAARADRAARARVLTNLVGNAIKFTERGTVAVEVWAEDGSAWLRVTDSGVGIDPAFLPHVFDDFKQESSGASRSHEGSGLGLTITRGLVTMMDGEISAASEKGIGSTFTVCLPAA